MLGCFPQMTLGSGVWLVFRQIAIDRYGSMAQTPSLDILNSSSVSACREPRA
jgi:hypothetical protein